MWFNNYLRWFHLHKAKRTIRRGPEARMQAAMQERLFTFGPLRNRHAIPEWRLQIQRKESINSMRASSQDLSS